MYHFFTTFIDFDVCYPLKCFLLDDNYQEVVITQWIAVIIQYFPLMHDLIGIECYNSTHVTPTVCHNQA